MQGCAFCSIAGGETPAAIVHDDERTLAFLDHRPVFLGHVLLIPRDHHETLADLPTDTLEPLFGTAQIIVRAIGRALAADGTFVAINNVVSQSVPHVHVHIVPRRRKDGLRGFFWPRQRYPSDQALEETRAAIAAEVARER